MDLINQMGISYKASYLVQGNLQERCVMSNKLRVNNTELQMRSDGKDFDITSIFKIYNGNVIFHIPTISIDLENLRSISSRLRNLISDGIKLVTINASNLSLDLFEWSTIDEQKKYFLNIVTGIATLASNKIVVCVENLPSKGEKAMFGSNYNQISDIIVYSRKLLVKDFGFTEEEAIKYIGLCFNISNIEDNNNFETIDKWFNIFNKNIKCIKFSSIENTFIDNLFELIIQNDYTVPILFETNSDIEEIGKEYNIIDYKIKEKLKKYNISIGDYKINKPSNSGFSDIIVLSIIVITIVIAVLMVIVKLH